MTRLTAYTLVLGLFVLLNVAASTVNAEANEANGILDCFFEINSLSCAKERTDAALDTIEEEVTGRKSSVSFSKIFEEAGALVVDGARSLLGQSDEVNDDVEDNEDGEDEGRSGLREARKKKIGKKHKKKLMQKLTTFLMLFKSKLSFILQLISTHIQVKFFAIAVISLLLNVARLWIHFKKDSTPAKVVYYEHAQHQHHYDREDEQNGYWGRSDQPWSAQEMAYNAHQDKN